MGQKVNPISLRLHPQNKHFDSCWFSEKRYADSLHKDLDIGTYYNAILKQIQYPSASYFLEASPRKSQISFLFLNPKQLREQSFRQLGNVNSRTRRRKQNTLFSTKKETTSLYGLIEKKRWFLRVLPPYFFTPLFLQTFKKRSSVFLLDNVKREREDIKGRSFFTKVESLMVSSFLQVREMGSLDKDIISSPNLLGDQNRITRLFTQFKSFSEKKDRMPLLLSKTGRRFAPFFSGNIEQEQVKMASRQNYLQLKKNVCSSLLGLSISRYFVQKSLSGNFLSATSRFLLLQALFPFLKKEKGWSDTLDKFCQQDGKFRFDVPEQVWTCDETGNKDFSFSLKENNTKSHSFLEEISFLQGSSFLSPSFFAEQKKTKNKDQNRQARLATGQSFHVNDGSNFHVNILQSKMPREDVTLCKTSDHHSAKQDLVSESKRSASPTGKQKNDLLSHLQRSSIYTYNMESIISNKLKSSCKILLFRAQNVAQSALLIAEEIAYQLQRRNSFRQIKTKFLQELANKSFIKGVRVTCVGRIGGRAKKAQRARGESFKMGQTSLHLFDSKVSFASKTAFTPYGAVGVKVWVCWK